MHEGHPGWRIDQLGNTTGGSASIFANWTRLRPDVIVLMAGTNDIGQLFNVSCDKSIVPWTCSVGKILDRMDRLLEQTIRALPKSHIFLSDLLGIGPNPCYGPDPTAIGDGMVAAFNKGLPRLADKHQHAVTHVKLAHTDIGQGGQGLCPCQYHPTHNSYAIIASVFEAAIRRHFAALKNDPVTAIAAETGASEASLARVNEERRAGVLLQKKMCPLGTGTSFDYCSPL